jgi:hypothetical protein
LTFASFTPISLIQIYLGLKDQENAYKELLVYVDAGGSSWPLELPLGLALEELAREPRLAELPGRLGHTPMANSPANARSAG